jgi:hypothetical protein
MGTLTLLAFWQFASGSMLFWSFAAAAPLLIHLFTRRRYRKMTWAAMEYLLAAMQKNRRRLQVEHWLLLAVRTVLLLLFSLALADPVLSKVQSLFFASSTQPTHHIFILDGSYSMDLRSEGVSRFEAAKVALRERLAQTTQGDGYSLLLLAEPPRVIIGEPAFDTNEVLEELESLELTHASADAQAMFRELETLLATTRNQHARLTATEITFVGDLEKSTWESLTTPEAAKRLTHWAESASLHLLDVGLEQPANGAVVNLRLSDAPVTIDREFTVQGEIVQFGTAAESTRLATLVVDQEAVAQQSVELSRNGTAEVAFRHRFATPGDHTLEIRLANDVLPLDDQRFLSVPVREALRTLCVYGRPGETQYLAAALAPEKSRSARVQVEEVNESAMLEKNLADYDAVFLANLPKLSSTQVQWLAAYVQAGGSLALFPGDQLVPGEFAPRDDLSEAFFPASYVATSAVGDYRFDPLEYRHEIIQPFRGFERAGLLTTPVWKYAQMQLAPREAIRTPLAFLNKDAAMVEGRFGRGAVIMFAVPAAPTSVDVSTTPATPWTAFPTWPSFPPLVQETLAFVSRSQDQMHNAVVQETIGASLVTALPETTVQLTTPASTKQAPAPRRLPLESKGDRWQWSFPETTHVGIYSVEYGAPIQRTEQFAVNLEPRESALERIDATRLPPALLKANALPHAAGTFPSAGPVGNSWFRALLCGVLLLLALESLLVTRFSGGAA